MTLALALMIVFLAAWYVVVVFTRPTWVGDEYHHVPAIRGIVTGDWTSARGLPMAPTYHVLVALLARVLGTELWALRLVNPLLGIATLVFMYTAIRARCPAAGAHTLLRFALNPLLLPLWVFVYTDVAALLGVVAALNFYVRGRHLSAAAALFVACLVRQSNVVWALLFAGLAVLDLWRADGRPAAGWRTAWRNLRLHSAARVVWPYALAFVLGVVWLVLCARATLTYKLENRPQANIAQFYVLFLTAALLWAPLWLAHLARVWSRSFTAALERPWTCAAVIAAVGALELLFDNPHPWNLDRHYLRNWPLYAMTYSLAARYLLALCIVAFVVTYVHATWRSPARGTLAVVWIFSLLFLLPHFLVDPRYYIVPLVLLDFFTPYTPAQARHLSIWYLLLTLLVGVWIVVQPGDWSGVW